MAAKRKAVAVLQQVAKKAKATVAKKPPAAVVTKTKAAVASTLKRPAAASTPKNPATAATKAAASLDSKGAAIKKLGTKEIASLIDSSTPYKTSMRPAPLKSAALNVISWNVNGLTALLKSRPDALADLVKKEKPDLIFLQETKLQSQNVEEIKARCVPDGWDSAWVCSKEQLGYAGVAALWRKGSGISASADVGCPEADIEGRCLTVELPGFYVVGCYVPNAGDGLKRLDFRIKQWEPAIAKHLAKLQAKKPVVFCGDLNVCHEELDLWGNHGPNSKGAGYTPEERQAMTDLLKGNGLVDSFRQKHPNARGFSYWSYRFNGRAKNNGWRLDYCLVPESLMPRVHDAFILPDVMGSDHCPVGLVLK